MILQVEFVVPGRGFEIAAGDFAFHVVEEAARGSEFEFGENGGGLFQPHRFIEHLARGSAAMIADAVEVHDLGKWSSGT